MRRPEQKIIFVTGKGGVGKSSVAAAKALSYANSGKKVLLAELGEKSFLQHIFPEAGQTAPRSVTNGLDVVRFEPEACLREYIGHYVPLDRLVDLFFSNRIMRTFINAAPALRELALMGKITSGPRGVGPDLPYDVVVIDGYATGHFKALVMAPIGMSQAVRFGPMADQCQSMVETLRNPKQTEYILVTLAEELPLNETEDLVQFISTTLQQEPNVVVNRNVNLPLSGVQLNEMKKTLGALTPSRPELFEYADYLIELGRRQDEAIERAGKWKGKAKFLPMILTQQLPELIRKLSQELEKK